MKRVLIFAVALLSQLFTDAQTGHGDSTRVVNADNKVRIDYSDDWAQLHKYREQNSALPATDSNSRIIFLGSSIFEFWKQLMPEYFDSHPSYIDRGISGQISGQLLIRFQQDVIALHPKAVLILAGSNDISGDHGHVTNETILDNVRSMVELARLHHITPVICLYLPIGEYPWRKEIKSAPLIVSLNEALSAFAQQNNLPVIDYFTPLADSHNAQKAELTRDGVHPNKAGYEVMAKVTDAVLSAL